MIRTFNNGTLSKEQKAIQHITSHLSEQNKNEAHILFGDNVSLHTVLKEQAEATESGFILYSEDGVPHGIGGVMKDRTVWFVLSEEHTRAMRISWLKGGYKWFTEQLKRYRTIHGFCWQKNELSMKWMRFFGFDFAPVESEATATIAGEKFLYFHKTV